MSCQHTSMEAGKCDDCGYCQHEVIYFGLCAVCGQSVDLNDDSGSKDHIDMNHKTTGIKVSLKEAERLEKEDEKRLLREKKLSLIVDLDQTILHAAWEPHIAKWVDENKNDKRAKDMSTFSLDGSMSKYTIKLRPGLREFLSEISKYYEMHIYTMGTRAYADAVVKIIDPNGNLFQDRILSRDENGSMTKKRLERLFPSDQTKVIILDDRADVWDYSPNLIQMKPYEYFAGIGDINAPPNQPKSTIPTNDTDLTVPANDADSTTQPLEQNDIVSERVLSADGAENKEELVSTEKPASTTENPLPITEQPKQAMPSLEQPFSNYTPKLHDSDNILPIIKDVLIRVHHEFYAEIEKRRDEKLNVASILSSLKSQILNTCCIVFSGVIPLQYKPEDSSIWRMATSFGAKCLTELTGKVTHLVAATVGTSKVNTARKYDSIKIVSPSWLTNSAWEWKRQDEEEYLMTLPREGSTASEIENPEESSLDFEDDKLDIDWDDSEVDAALEDSEDDDDDDDDTGGGSKVEEEKKDKVDEDEDEEYSDEGYREQEKEEIDDYDEEASDFDEDWLANELGGDDDDNDDSEKDDFGEMEEERGVHKRKRDSDEEEESSFTYGN